MPRRGGRTGARRRAPQHRAGLARPWFTVEPADWGEARRVFRELAARGPLHHRQVKIPDLRGYEIIASVTGQPTRWADPRGTV
jgi:hypothetical protein